MTRTRIFACGFALALGGLGRAQWTERVNVSWIGTQGGGDCARISISANGRFVVFDCDDSNFVPGDANGFRDVFLRDRILGTTELISVGLAGAMGDGYSTGPRITPDGRFVVFQSDATNLVAADTNAYADIFIRDREAGTTERVSISSTGVQGDHISFQPVVSDNGRIVAFSSVATTLAGLDMNGASDVFVRDRFLQVTERISLSTTGTIPGGNSYAPSISSSGNFVAFESEGSLVPNDTNGTFDIFIRDRIIGTTERVSNAAGGSSSNGASMNARISSGGDYVVFDTLATNIVSGDTNGTWDVVINPLFGGVATQRVSVSSGGVQANLPSNLGGISADSRYVLFTSEATNLDPADTNGFYDIYLRDRELGQTELITVSLFGGPADGPSYECALNADGRRVAFVSYATNLVGGDTNLAVDAFLRERGNGTNFTSMCHPGYGIVMGCPCANPPSGTGRGCNNTANTGGAILSATGTASLSSDSLTFITSGELPSALSMVVQGTSAIHGGFMLNNGIRCWGGHMRRLYTKTAIGGSITAPEFGAGDVPVSVRSAQLGITIQPADSLYYAVWYRDPVTPCVGIQNNVTQTGEVVWAP